MIKNIITILKAYPAIDVFKDSDKSVIRRQLYPNEITEELLRSYAVLHGDLYIVPKLMSGNSPRKVEDETMVIPRNLLVQTVPQTLSGLPDIPVSSGNSDMYRIMYEREREEAKDWKQKYETTLEQLRQKEIALAEQKPDVMGDVMKGLAGFAPLLMNQGAGALGSTPQTPAKPNNLQPINDNRLTAIIGYWPKIDENTKNNIYNIVALILTKPDKAEAVLTVLNETENLAQ
jgi:hypothetical protein